MVKHYKENNDLDFITQKKIYFTFKRFYIKSLELSNNNLPIVQVMCYDRVSRMLNITYYMRVKVTDIKKTAEEIVGSVSFEVTENEHPDFGLIKSVKIYAI